MAWVSGQLVGRQTLCECGFDPEQGVGHRVLSHVVANVLPQSAVFDNRPSGSVHGLAERRPEAMEVQGNYPSTHR